MNKERIINSIIIWALSYILHSQRSIYVDGSIAVGCLDNIIKINTRQTELGWFIFDIITR